MKNKGNETILQITDYAAPYEGNFINSLKVLEEHLNRDNIKMIYMFPKEAKSIDWVNVLKDNCNEINGRKVTFLSEGVLNNVKLIRSIIRENNVKIIHSHFCLPKTQLAIKICCILEKDVKLVQHFHNHYQLPNDVFKKNLFKYIFKGDFNIGCSDSVAKSIAYKPDKVVSITNAIYFPRLDEYEKLNRESFDIKKNDIVILMFGFDYIRKGVDIAIRALEPIAEKYNIVLAISISVGKEKVEKQIKADFGYIPSWVKILPARDDISSYYHMANMFLSSAREEGFCYALVEAAYCNLNCISSKIPGPPLDMPNLNIFNNEDYKGLSEKIEYIINTNSYDNIKKLEQTRKYVIEKYNINTWAEKVIEVYKKF